MAKLEFYRQQILPQATGGQPNLGMYERIGRQSAETVEQIARASQSVAGAIGQRNLEIEKRREDEAAIDASAKVAQARKDWVQREQERQNAALEAGEFDGYTGRLDEEFRKQSDELVAGAKTESARNWMRERMDQLGLSLFERGMAFEARAKVERDVRLVGESLDSSMVTVDAAPGEYEAAREDLMLQYARLPAEQRAKLWDQADQQLAYSAGIGAVRDNPRAILKALDAEPGKAGVAYIDRLDLEGRLRLRSVAETEIRQIEAEARARQAENREILRDRIANQTAMVMDGVAVPKPISRGEFIAAGMGEAYQDYAETMQLGPDMAALQRMPASEIPAYLAAKAPAATEDGYATRSKLYGVLEQRAAGIVKAREDDPGAFLYQSSPAVRQAYDQMNQAQTPEQMTAAAQRYATAAAAESKRLGISNPAILPKSYADALTAQFYAGQGEKGGEPAAIGIMAEKQKWGRYWPQVFRQIAPELPGTAFVIGTGMRTGPAGRLAELGQLKDDEVNKLLPAGTSTKDVKDAVREELADMQASILGQPGDARLMGMLDDAAYRLAVSYLAAGKDVSDAATQAAAEVVNERYQFEEVRDSIVRIPAQVPAGDVRSALRSIWNRDVKPLGYQRLDDATWQTMPGDEGVVLMYGNAPVKRPDGSLIQYTWSELRNRRATDVERIRELDQELGPSVRDPIPGKP